MIDLAKTGYDTAAVSRAEDDLDRWRFAADIVDVVLTTPPDWSARIGIFGKWGEGKSTVMRFAERMLRDRGSIVFWFNPWAIQNWNELWNDFGERLAGALSTAGIRVDSPWFKGAKKLKSKKVGQLVRVGAAVAGREKAAEAAFGLLGDWLKYDGPQIRKIQAKAKGKRLIVLVDDLDRCNPDLLPQLLLSLRELLDLPGFTFLLAFDDEIVSRALIDTNPAWSEGSDFLEKILDFRFYLPPVSEKQKEKLVYRSLSKYCPFVPAESVKSIHDLLPSNPRKLKTLIRSLAALRPQITRHGADEFVWTDIWLAQLLKLESYAFFDRLMTADLLDREVGSLYRLLRERARRGLTQDNQEKDPELRRLIAESRVTNQGTIDRILKLIDAARARATLQFRYACEMAIRPHAVTSKEFNELFARWSKDRRSPILLDWIKQQVSERHVSDEDVKDELFESIINKRHGCLAAAAESASVPEHDQNTGQASLLWHMAGQYLIDLKMLGVAAFKRMYGQASYWIGFWKNLSDKALREEEEQLLLRLLHAASPELSSGLFEAIYPDNMFPGVDETTAPRAALREKCMAIVYPKAAEEALEFCRRESGINTLFEGNRFFAVKCCLFLPDSPVWAPRLQSKLIEIVRSGRDNSIVSSNVRDFFRILIQGIQTGVDSIRREEIQKTLANEKFVRSIWETITARGIQYRMQISFLNGRELLISRGVREDLLPLTEDLRSRLDEAKSKHELDPVQ